MPSPAQTRAIKTYRRKLSEGGLVRFEVVGREHDRDLIRKLARLLSEETAEASAVRDDVSRALGEKKTTGGILAALRRSPLVEADINLDRPKLSGREIEL